MLIVICGATATGKSGLALEIAQRLGAVILSADSRQVYRDFNIGTAKPTAFELNLVPHYLIDICAPTETLTLADYQAKTQDLIRNLPQPILLVGGTGLYIKSIVKGMKIPRVAPQAEIRSQLTALGQIQCYAMLQQVDPEAALKIHPNDNFRTLRALEVFYVTGAPISTQQGQQPPTYPILQIGLDCDRDNLRNRLTRRTEEMLKLGWLDEIKFLQEKYGDDLPLLNTLGYQEMRQYLAGKIDLSTAKELTVIHTGQFAKRQKTFFKSLDNIQWFNAQDSDLLNQVLAKIRAFLIT
jgi:tRNA dimethylallyltransferase